jgi:hypothetical protein
MTTLPTPLVRFRGELEAAIGRQQEAPGRRRLPVLRVAIAACVAAAVAVGALATLPGGPGGRLVEPASAAARAPAALAARPGSIVHVDMVVTQRNPDGSRTRWREESWQQTAPPYDERQIVTREDGTSVETATVDGDRQSYDPAGNVVDVAPSGSESTPPSEATPQPVTAQPFRDQVVDLLRSGKLTQSGRGTVDGRPTISFAWNDGHARYEYTVEAGTYEPVRWQISPTDGTPSATVSFETYETLPAGSAPLDLTRLHPDASVRHRP